MRIDALHMIGIAAPADQRETWNLSAIKVVEESTETEARSWLGSLLNSLVWTYFKAERFTLALDHLERALAWHLEHGTTETTRIAKRLVGRALRACGQCDSALAIQLALVAESGEAGLDGYVYVEIAECLFELNRIEESLPWFTLAFTEHSNAQWLAENQPYRIERLRQRAAITG